MRVIGLTGGIASGKSSVSAWLQRQPGCVVVDADQLSRALTAPGGKALPSIRKSFGDSFFLPDGSLDRRRLGRHVFSNPGALALLDQIMAPFLEQMTEEALSRARDSGAVLCFLDYPLLFEKGYARFCDAVWCVYLPHPLQVQRLMQRDHLSLPEAESRIRCQMSSEEKAAKSDVVIDNSGSPEQTQAFLPSLLSAEMERARSPRRRRSARYDDSPFHDQLPEASVSPLSFSPSSPAFAPSQGTGNPNGETKEGTRPSRAETDGIDRPPSARKGPSRRKAAWKMPFWLTIVLISLTALLLICGTAQILMNAYLVRQDDRHRKEHLAILSEYPLEYRDIIESSSGSANLSPAFVAAIIRNESSFQPMAESSVGARGLMQLMPATAEWIAGKMKVSGYAFERMYDPESNVRFGCWYLQYLSNLFHGDPVCVACAYHAGQGQVTAWLSDPRLSKDGVHLSLDNMEDGPTKTYARRVIRAYGIYQKLYFESSSPDLGARAGLLSVRRAIAGGKY